MNLPVYWAKFRLSLASGTITAATGSAARYASGTGLVISASPRPNPLVFLGFAWTGAKVTQVLLLFVSLIV